MKAKIVSLVIMLVLFATPATFAQTPTQLQCGTILEDEFIDNPQLITYELDLSAGDRLMVSAVTIGDAFGMVLGLYGPDEMLLAFDGQPASGISMETSYTARPTQNPNLETDVLGSNGTYTIAAYNSRMFVTGDIDVSTDVQGGIGAYTLYVGCTLRDGTVIEPGEAVEVGSEGSSAPPALSVPAFGFPGVTPRDFSAGIELPLTAGTPQLAPVANDVALYTYAATADETRTLLISRASGDLSIGVTVIRQETNEILFLGGMPASNNLSVEITFPADATYVVGLFRLDTAERTGTSGAVQVTLE